MTEAEKRYKLDEWSYERLYNKDFSDRDINYNKSELREQNVEELFLNLHE